MNQISVLQVIAEVIFYCGNFAKLSTDAETGAVFCRFSASTCSENQTEKFQLI